MNTTLKYAEYELKKYSAMMGICPEISFIVDADKFDKTRFFRFDASLDDAFIIVVKDGKGTITATNERSVLMGVYQFLKLQGCRFMRPGKDGEYVPYTEKIIDIDEEYYAYTRHRGTEDYGFNGGIEGVLAIIEWLPKLMMNTFFIENVDFFYLTHYRYYPGENPFKKKLNVTREIFGEWEKRIIKECKKRGIIRHSCGHGWTNLLMKGIDNTRSRGQLILAGDTEVCENPEILAQINGKRELLGGVPLNTNVCLSQPEVMKAYAQKVYEYVLAHPECDYLHVWLADAFSNFCECENCRDITPTDWYIKLMNEVDALLTKNGSKQKIVFLVYFELLYPPKTERLNNPERFTMLFCPYGRDFTKTYRETEVPEKWEQKELNKYLRSDMNMSLYLAQLRDWKKIFDGDSLAFDYTLYDYSAHTEFTNLLTAPIAADDCIYLKEIGLNGRIECGNVRASSPTSITFCSMAHSLFYGSIYPQEEFFKDMFGEGEPVSDFLESIKNIIPRDYLMRKRASLSDDELLEIKNGLEKIESFRQVLLEYNPEESFFRKNCLFLEQYLEFPEAMCRYILKIHENKDVSAQEIDGYVEELRLLLFRLEQAMPLYFPAQEIFVQMRYALTNYGQKREF